MVQAFFAPKKILPCSRQENAARGQNKSITALWTRARVMGLNGEIRMNIVVIDGQGGRLGRKLVEGIHERCPRAEITAIGTNSTATENMKNTGCAARLATGENAVVVACRAADLIVGPFGIAMADALLGEISPKMANAVSSSPAYRVLIPMNLCDTYVAWTVKGSSAILEDALEHIQALADAKKE